MTSIHFNTGRVQALFEFTGPEKTPNHSIPKHAFEPDPKNKERLQEKMSGAVCTHVAHGMSRWKRIPTAKGCYVEEFQRVRQSDSSVKAWRTVNKKPHRITKDTCQAEKDTQTPKSTKTLATSDGNL